MPPRKSLDADSLLDQPTESQNTGLTAPPLRAGDDELRLKLAGQLLLQMRLEFLALGLAQLSQGRVRYLPILCVESAPVHIMCCKGQHISGVVLRLGMANDDDGWRHRQEPRWSAPPGMLPGRMRGGTRAGGRLLRNKKSYEVYTLCAKLYSSERQDIRQERG